ncbi:hypothetical protein BDY24DRAFT_386629 [Mrakia frigida]|uniref:uncharacterized protein n=1 Tax=Mrakia frigida TaxID=29902 RepID=UPI003FCC10A2
MSSSSSGLPSRALNPTLVLRMPPLDTSNPSNPPPSTLPSSAISTTKSTGPPPPSLLSSPTLYLCPSCPTGYETLLARSHHVHNWHDRKTTIKTALGDLVFHRGEESDKFTCTSCLFVALPADAFRIHVLRCLQKEARRDEQEEEEGRAAALVGGDTPSEVVSSSESRTEEDLVDVDMEEQPRRLDKGKGREVLLVEQGPLGTSTSAASTSSSSTPLPPSFYSASSSNNLEIAPPIDISLTNPLPLPSPSNNFERSDPIVSTLLPPSALRTCPLCSKTFGGRSSLSSHHSDFHATPRSITTPFAKLSAHRGDDGKLSCPKCPSHRFFTGRRLREHLTTACEGLVLERALYLLKGVREAQEAQGEKYSEEGNVVVSGEKVSTASSRGAWTSMLASGLSSSSLPTPTPTPATTAASTTPSAPTARIPFSSTSSDPLNERPSPTPSSSALFSSYAPSLKMSPSSLSPFVVPRPPSSSGLPLVLPSQALPSSAPLQPPDHDRSRSMSTTPSPTPSSLPSAPTPLSSQQPPVASSSTTRPLVAFAPPTSSTSTPSSSLPSSNLTGINASLPADSKTVEEKLGLLSSTMRRLVEVSATNDARYANLNASKLALQQEVESLRLALEEGRYSRTVDVSRLEEEKRLLVVSRAEERVRLEKVVEDLRIEKGSAQMGQQSVLDEKELLVARHKEEREALEKKLEETRLELELARSEKDAAIGEKELLVLEQVEEENRWEREKEELEGEKQELKEEVETLEAELVLGRAEEVASGLKLEGLEKEKKKLKMEVEKASKLTSELLANLKNTEENDPTPTRRATRGSIAAQATTKTCSCQSSPLPRPSLKRQRPSEPIEALNNNKHPRLVEPSPSPAPLPVPSPVAVPSPRLESPVPKPPQAPAPDATSSVVPKVEKGSNSLDKKFASGIPSSGIDREEFLKFWTEKLVKQKKTGDSVCHFCLKGKTPSTSSSTPLQLSSDASGSGSTRVQEVIAHLESSHWTSWQRLCQPGGLLGGKSVE